MNQEQEGYTPPEEVAKFDPFGVRKRKLEEEAASLEAQAPPKAKETQAIFERADIQEAQELMGEDFYGPEEIQKAFGVELREEEIPPQPFSRQELEHFREEGCFLTLRIDHDQDDNPLTIKQLKTLYGVDSDYPETRIFYNQDWYERPENLDPFFTHETPRVQWALVKKEILKDSTNKNYQAQEGLLDQYRQGQQPHLEGDHQIQRREAVDIAYDLILAFRARGQKLLPDNWDWSKTKLTQGADAGHLAGLGRFDADGFNVFADQPSVVDGFLGVCPSVVSQVET